MLMHHMSIVERIKQRRYQMLVHSYLYYQRDESIVDDSTFDRWARELVQLQQEHPHIAEQVEFHNHFIAFDGTTGFDLPFTMPKIQNIGDRLLRYKSST